MSLQCGTLINNDGIEKKLKQMKETLSHKALLLDII